MLGGILKAEEDKIRKCNNATIKSVAVIIVGYLMAFAEYLVYKAYLDVYFSTVVISVGLISFAIVNRDKYLNKFLYHIGKKLSTIIYCLHLPVIYIIDKSSIFKNFIFGSYGLPIIVVIITVLISELIYQIGRKIKQLLN